LEREVRTALTRELQTVLEPLYARFYDRYVEIDKGSKPALNALNLSLIASLSLDDRALTIALESTLPLDKTLHMEREVRTALTRELQTVLEPLYARFYDRYVEV
jgi:hypothetical protein